MKKFLNKLKSDVKFKQAGSGKKLDTSTSGSSGKRPAARQSKPQQQRRPVTGDARKAGQAALERAEAHSNKEVNWSHQAIKARARREMEAERKMAEMSLNEQQQQPASLDSPFCENREQLAVDGVYFHCHFIGDDVNTYEVIKENIRQLLYSQLPDDPAMVSCLIIHSCNKGKQKVTDCIQTLCKCVDNIIENPTEEKYRKIRHSTKTYQERISPINGAMEFLQAAGFELQILPHNDTTVSFWVFPEEKLGDLQTLESLRDCLISAEPLKPQLDRDVRVLFPLQAKECTELPREFFSITADELRREMQARKDDVERREMLMTKAMRDKLEVKEIRKYKFTLIRIRFPNQILLQGTFGVYEKLSTVKEFVQAHIIDSDRPFNLHVAASLPMNPSDDDQSLFDLRMVPNVLFNFSWEAHGASAAEDDFLNEEAMQLLQ